MWAFRKTIRKYLQNKGLDIQKFPSPAEFHDALEQESPAIQEYKFRTLSESIQLAENKAYYERLLKVFVPNWSPPKKSEFVGKGKGKGSLNTYRKVKEHDSQLFEKVYINHHRSLESVLWFDKHIQPLLQGKIEAPKVHKYTEGPLITVVYFDFFKLTPLEKNQEQSFIRATQDLYAISKKNKDDLAQLAWLKRMVDYKKPRYTKQIRKLKKEIPDAEYIVKKQERIAEQSKYILTHSDISKNNAFEGKVLLDWDYFGLYPLGFDVAIVYHKLLRDGICQNFNYVSWLYTHYKDLIAKEEWEPFKLNFLYFLWVYSFQRPGFQSGKGEKLVNQLMEVLYKTGK